MTAGFVARLLFKGAFRLKVVGAERIPLQGPLIVVANHESFLDGPLLVSVFTERRLTFFSSAYLFDKRTIGFFLRRMGALPVQRDHSNLSSLKRAIAILRGGGTMAVFPEGGIARSEILGGAAYLALKADAPLLPLYIAGTKEALPPGKKWPSFAPITVHVGMPLHSSDIAGRSSDTKSAVAEATRVLGRVLAEHPSGA